MTGRRTRVLLWALALILVLAIPLLVWLQVRWAHQLWDAESERARLEVAEQLDAMMQDLARDLMRWNLGVQQTPIGTLAAPTNPRPSWRAQGLMTGLVDSVYLRLPAGEGDEDGVELSWFEFPVTGEPIESAAPQGADALESGEESPFGSGLLPRRLDDGRLMLSVRVPYKGLVFDPQKSPAQMLDRSPVLWVFLNAAAFTDWLDRRVTEHWGDLGPHVGYAVMLPLASGDEVQLFGAPRPASLEDGLGTLRATLDLRHALGETLALRAETCQDDPTCARAERKVNGASLPAVFMTLPGAGERWEFEAWIHGGAIGPQLRQLWKRNLAIGLAAVGVLGAAVALLMVLTLQAQRLARAQFDFVTGVSHELRTPISVLRSASANLADGVVSESPQVRRYGQVLRKEVRRLGDLVEKIIGFAQSGEPDDLVGEADLQASLERVGERLRAEMADREASLELQIGDDLPAVAAQPWVLDSVLHNLLSNALKYGGPKICVEAKMTRVRRRPAVEVTVRDWGPGLSRAERRRVFEPFFRGRRARAEQQPGAGLGLSWVARLAERCGGKLVAESSPGQGSRFGVALPAAGGDA